MVLLLWIHILNHLQLWLILGHRSFESLLVQTSRGNTKWCRKINVVSSKFTPRTFQSMLIHSFLYFGYFNWFCNRQEEVTLWINTWKVIILNLKNDASQQNTWTHYLQILYSQISQDLWRNILVPSLLLESVTIACNFVNRLVIRMTTSISHANLK